MVYHVLSWRVLLDGVGGSGGVYAAGISVFVSTSAATAPMPSVQHDQIWGQTLAVSWFPQVGLENRRLSNNKGGGSRGQRPPGK